jgi:hypothetical protein
VKLPAHWVTASCPHQTGATPPRKLVARANSIYVSEHAALRTYIPKIGGDWFVEMEKYDTNEL